MGWFGVCKCSILGSVSGGVVISSLTTHLGFAAERRLGGGAIANRAAISTLARAHQLWRKEPSRAAEPSERRSGGSSVLVAPRQQRADAEIAYFDIDKLCSRIRPRGRERRDYLLCIRADEDVLGFDVAVAPTRAVDRCNSGHQPTRDR